MGRTCNCGSSAIEEDSALGISVCTMCGTVLEESIITSEVTFEDRGTGGGQVIGQFVKQGQGVESVHGIHGPVRTESREQTFFKGRKLIQEVNVYDLGRVLNFLTRNLHINLPTTDPCLYIIRFAVLLDLGDRLKDVADLATRIVNRMKRDWLGMGRRPTGLCGAALLLAARAHNYNRSIADIVRVVHISESVVRKRLDEFASTPSGSLTIEDFNNVDLEHNEDPPAYQESKRRAKETQESTQLEEISKQIEPVQREIEDELKKRLKSHPFAKMIVGMEDEDVPELYNSTDIICGEVLESVYQEMDEPSTSNSNATHQPSLASLGIYPRNNNQNCATTINPCNIERDDGELDLAGIDDLEIDTYLLTESESKLKERMWMARNSHHLKEMERKRKLREEEELKEKENPKKKRKSFKKKDEIHAATHNEAMVQIIHEKKLSNKINYDVLCSDDFGVAVEKKDEDRRDKTEFGIQLPEIQPTDSANVVPASESALSIKESQKDVEIEKSHDEACSTSSALKKEISKNEVPLPESNKEKDTEGQNPPTQSSRRMHVKARPNLGKAGKVK